MRDEIYAEIIKKDSPAYINLSGKNIEASEIGEILEEIKKTKPAVEVIDLDNNKLNDGGAIILGDFLPVLTHLKELHLQFNNIGRDGALHVFAIKRTLPELIILFRGNQITDTGEMYDIEHLAVSSASPAAR